MPGKLTGDYSRVPVSIQPINWQLLLIELFVVLSLSVAYFFLVRNYVVTGDSMNRIIFTAGSEKVYRLGSPIMGGHWNGRLASLMLSGTLIDFSLNEHNYSPELKERWSNVFGLYHTFWLLMLFVAVTFALRHSLFINLGIFAGLIYNFSPVSGPYFYPWDIPATLFFTLAVLFFERRQIGWLVAVTCAGCFFKETVLVCALLILFAGHWSWGKRILTVVGVIAVYILGGKLLLSHLHLEAPLFSVRDMVNLRGAFSPVTLMNNFMDNLKTFLSPTLNSVIFANAGTVVATLVLGWRRHFLPYMTVILAFLAGLFLIAPPPPGISEVRAFMEILPLSLILLSERWMAFAGVGVAGEASSEPAPAWAVRKTFPVLVPLTIMLIGLSTGVAARQYYIIFEELRQSQSGLGKYKLGFTELDPELLRKGYADAELELARISAEKNQFPAVIDYLEVALALDSNSVPALNNLAWLRATAPDPDLRNGKEAVRLAERACQLTQFEEIVPIRTLAAAYAEAGRFDDAVATAQKALAMVLAQEPKELAAEDEQLLVLYKSGRAFRQKVPTAP